MLQELEDHLERSLSLVLQALELLLPEHVLGPSLALAHPKRN